MSIYEGFNVKSLVDNVSANDDTYDLSSSKGREAYFDDILNNPDFEKYDNDVVAWKLSDTGNEQAYYELRERADVSGGELGYNHSIEKAVDKKMDRFDGSLSQNLDDDAQATKELSEAYGVELPDASLANWSEDEILALSTPQTETLELFLPEIDYLLDQDDPGIAIQALVVEMESLGVSPSEIDAAMKSGNDFDVLNALTDVAEKNGLSDLVDYGRDVRSAFVGPEVELVAAGPQIAPVEPQLSANDLNWEGQSTKPLPLAMGWS